VFYECAREVRRLRKPANLRPKARKGKKSEIFVSRQRKTVKGNEFVKPTFVISESSYLKDLRKLWESPKFSDLMFQTDDGEYNTRN
jgi:hypothetical protein